LKFREYVEFAVNLHGHIFCENKYSELKQVADDFQWSDKASLTMLSPEIACNKCSEAFVHTLSCSRFRLKQFSAIVRLKPYKGCMTEKGKRNGDRSGTSRETRQIEIQQLHESKWWHQSAKFPTRSVDQLRLRVLQLEPLTTTDNITREAWQLLKQLKG
jgi:hypothetical protein